MNEQDIYTKIAKNTATMQAIESQITDLADFATQLLDSSSEFMEITIEEMPSNGNVMLIKPIFDPRAVDPNQPYPMIDEESREMEQNLPSQVGYAKVFKDLDNIQPISSAMVGMPSEIALGAIDHIIKSLKNKVETLKKENRKYITR